MPEPSPQFINWTLNIWDLLMIGACAAVLYARLATLETRMEPLWTWWNKLAESGALGMAGGEHKR